MTWDDFKEQHLDMSADAERRMLEYRQQLDEERDARMRREPVGARGKKEKKPHKEHKRGREKKERKRKDRKRSRRSESEAASDSDASSAHSGADSKVCALLVACGVARRSRPPHDSAQSPSARARRKGRRRRRGRRGRRPTRGRCSCRGSLRRGRGRTAGRTRTQGEAARRRSLCLWLARPHDAQPLVPGRLRKCLLQGGTVGSRSGAVGSVPPSSSLGGAPPPPAPPPGVGR